MLGKKQKIIIIPILIVVLFLGLYLIFKGNRKTFNDCKTVKEKVEYQMRHLTRDEKIAQMLIASYSSSEMDDNLKSILEANKPGGFILFKENFTSYDKTLKFINDIKSTSSIPMFIAVDQEGGVVQRFNKLDDLEVTQIPSMLEIGKTGDVSLSYDVGKVIAEELKTLGINMDFAPVIDVLDSEENSFIKTRSFGTNLSLVSDMGVNIARGLEDNGILPVYKHFPGHGSTVEDSHYTLPTVKKTKKELVNSDLLPFKRAIENGAKIIMIGHLAVPAISKDVPASLSKEIITDLLKNELNYKGLVITDALNMGALTNTYQEQKIYEMAINAGVDMLLMPKTTTSAIKFINDSIEKGKIKESTIDESVRKILTLKYEKLSNDKIFDKSFLGSNEHKKIISKISDK